MFFTENYGPISRSEKKKKKTIAVYFVMRGFFERGIVRSPRLDCVKLILIKSGFDRVWKRESFSGVNRLCKHISDSL